MESRGPVLDHVVLAARSRADIDAQLAELGLAAGSGRSIPGAGLANVVVAVGTQLLEAHYPDGTPVEEGGPPYARTQRETLEAHPDVTMIPVAWVVRFESEHLLRAASDRAGYPTIAVPSEPPNNGPYLLGGFGAAFERPWLPAFIHWSRPPHLPPPLVKDRVRGPNQGWLTLDVAGPEAELHEWCGSVPGRVRVEAGQAGPLRVWVHAPHRAARAVGLPPT